MDSPRSIAFDAEECHGLESGTPTGSFVAGGHGFPIIPSEMSAQMGKELSQPSSSVQPKASLEMLHELSTELDPQLRRGVPLTAALAGFGKHWAQPRDGQLSSDPGSFELSQPTSHFDSFISHDWGSGGRLKVLSLLVVYNSQAAFFSSMSVSVLVGILRVYGILPDEFWTVLFGHVTFVLVLCFWQTLRELVCSPLIVFMDKLCIAQHDTVMKQRGILSLAGFLLESRKLVVLWSPQYFNRLWCMFEVATFLKDPGNLSRIHFMPLTTGSVLVLSWAAWQVLGFGYNVITFWRGQALGMSAATMTFLVPTSMMLSLASLVVPVVYYLGIGFMSELQELPQQLAGFRVQDASCSCCEKKHRNPQNGRELICDRQLIFKMLRKWYGDARHLEGGEDMALEAFNGVVREQLAPRVMSHMGGRTLPINYTIYMLGACNLPFLANYISQWAQASSSEMSELELGIWTLRHFADWMLLVVVSIFATRVSLPLWRLGLALQRRKVLQRRLAVVAVTVPCGCLLVSMQFMSFVVTKAVSDELSLWPLLPLMGTLVSTALLYSRNCCRGQPRDADASREDLSEETPEHHGLYITAQEPRKKPWPQLPSQRSDFFSV